MGGQEAGELSGSAGGRRRERTWSAAIGVGAGEGRHGRGAWGGGGGRGEIPPLEFPTLSDRSNTVLLVTASFSFRYVNPQKVKINSKINDDVNKKEKTVYDFILFLLVNHM